MRSADEWASDRYVWQYAGTVDGIGDMRVYGTQRFSHWRGRGWLVSGEQGRSKRSWSLVQKSANQHTPFPH
jgi:hypothetical protein